MSITSLIRKIIKGADVKLIEKAFAFAKEAHQDQKRASGEDYIQHPLKVAEALKEMRLDSQTIAAGFLHDLTPGGIQEPAYEVQHLFSPLRMLPFRLKPAILQELTTIK